MKMEAWLDNERLLIIHEKTDKRWQALDYTNSTINYRFMKSDREILNEVMEQHRHDDKEKRAISGDLLDNVISRMDALLRAKGE